MTSTTFAVRAFSFGLALTLLTFDAARLRAGDAVASERPNIVFFLVDDLGYMDIGANNPSTFYETPNVDRLAKQGVRFTSGYAANPVCSPTRFSLMTGRHPSRVDATNFFSGRRGGRFRPAPLHDRMPVEEHTMAEVFREAGYRTAFLGKWHLGPDEAHWPEAQGFEFNVGGHHRGLPPGGYFSPYKNPRLTDGADGEHLTRRLADEAIRLIDVMKSDPFFLYLSFYTVHTPLQAPAELRKKYEEKAQRLGLQDKREFAPEEQVWPNAKARTARVLQRHATYAAMVESMDTAVGRVLDKLRQEGLDRNTIVCFTSDNGGLSTSEGQPTSNLPLRGGKGWVYEGGIREPFIIKAPPSLGGRSGAVTDAPVWSCDFFPTLLDLASVPLLPDEHEDGVSLKPLLLGDETAGRQLERRLIARPLYWHYPHYSNQGGFPGGAIRVGNLKLIERYEDGRVHLFDLSEEIGEREDLAEKRESDTKRLRQLLWSWYRDVDAKFLQPKPDGALPWRPGE